MNSTAKYKELFKILPEANYPSPQYYDLLKEIDFIWENELTKEERCKINKWEKDIIDKWYDLLVIRCKEISNDICN